MQSIICKDFASFVMCPVRCIITIIKVLQSSQYFTSSISRWKLRYVKLMVSFIRYSYDLSCVPSTPGLQFISVPAVFTRVHHKWQTNKIQRLTPSSQLDKVLYRLGRTVCCCGFKIKYWTHCVVVSVGSGVLVEASHVTEIIFMIYTRIIVEDWDQ